MISSLNTPEIRTAIKFLDVTDGWLKDHTKKLTSLTFEPGTDQWDEKLMDNGLLGKGFLGYDVKALAQEPDASKRLTENTSLGRIDLAIPYVNPQYLCGDKPVITKITGLSKKDIICLMNTTDAVVINPEDSCYNKGDIISTEMALEKLSDNSIITGAEAVEHLLEEKNADKELIERIILHSFPIVPPVFYTEPRGIAKEDKTYSLSSLGREYDELYIANEEYKDRVQEGRFDLFTLAAVLEIQTIITDIVLNGAEGSVKTGLSGCSILDFSDIYQIITAPQGLMTCRPAAVNDIPELSAGTIHALKGAMKQYREACEKAIPGRNHGASLYDLLGIRNSKDQAETVIKSAIRPFAYTAYETWFKDSDVDPDMLVDASFEKYGLSLCDKGYDPFTTSIYSYIDRALTLEPDQRERTLKNLIASIGSRMDKYIRTAMRNDSEAFKEDNNA